MPGEVESTDIGSWITASGDSLTRFAYLVIGDRDRALDAVQDALVGAYPRWQKIVATGDPGAYLRRCIVNADTSRWRKFVRKERLVADVAELSQQVVDDPALRLAADDAVQVLFRRLPNKQRAAVVLRYYEDLADDDIASILDCSVSTVRSQIHRALKTLREHMRGEEVNAQ